MHSGNLGHSSEAWMCEVRMVKGEDQTVFGVCLEVTVRRDVYNNLVFRVVLSNITKIEQTEDVLQKEIQGTQYQYY